MNLLALCAATFQFLLFGIFCIVIVGINVVRATVTLGSEILGVHFGNLYNYSIVECEEYYVRSPKKNR
jgi:hypothetical protein